MSRRSRAQLARVQQGVRVFGVTPASPSPMRCSGSCRVAQPHSSRPTGELKDPVSETILPYELLDAFVTVEFCIGEMLLGADRLTIGRSSAANTTGAVQIP
jgi:hypothetical protein